jgi:hypothetical protein
MNLDPQQDQGYPRTKRSSGSVGNAVESGWKNKKSMSGSITSMMNKPKESAPPSLEKRSHYGSDWECPLSLGSPNMKGKPKTLQIKTESEKHTLLIC